MADNYLEKRFEEFRNPEKKVVRKGGPSLDSLLLRNRSTRGFSQGRKVSEEELKKIVEVNTRIASSKNQQALRFKIVCDAEGAALINAHIISQLIYSGAPPPACLFAHFCHPFLPDVFADLFRAFSTDYFRAFYAYLRYKPAAPVSPRKG